jgi:hypothetical protein
MNKLLPLAAIFSITLVGVEFFSAHAARAGCNSFGCSESSVAECNAFGCPDPPMGEKCTAFGCPPSPQPQPTFNFNNNNSDSTNQQKSDFQICVEEHREDGRSAQMALLACDHLR